MREFFREIVHSLEGGQPVELVVEQLMTRSKRREVDESWI